MKKFLFFSMLVFLLAFASSGCKPDNAATNAGNKPAAQSSQNRVFSAALIQEKIDR